MSTAWDTIVLLQRAGLEEDAILAAAPPAIPMPTQEDRPTNTHGHLTYIYRVLLISPMMTHV